MRQRLFASFLLTLGLTFLYIGTGEKQLDELLKLLKTISETCIAGIP